MVTIAMMTTPAAALDGAPASSWASALIVEPMSAEAFGTTTAASVSAAPRDGIAAFAGECSFYAKTGRLGEASLDLRAIAQHAARLRPTPRLSPPRLPQV